MGGVNKRSFSTHGAQTNQSLTVRDLRHLSRAKDVFAALVEHLHLATNEGKIRTMISIFAPQEPHQPGIRIWNPQLIRYAGYRQPDGTFLGDPLMTRRYWRVPTAG